MWHLFSCYLFAYSDSYLKQSESQLRYDVIEAEVTVKDKEPSVAEDLSAKFAASEWAKEWVIFAKQGDHEMLAVLFLMFFVSVSRISEQVVDGFLTKYLVWGSVIQIVALIRNWLSDNRLIICHYV